MLGNLLQPGFNFFGHVGTGDWAVAAVQPDLKKHSDDLSIVHNYVDIVVCVTYPPELFILV